MPKIKPQTLNNTNIFWARQVPTSCRSPYLLVGFLSLDGPSTEKFLKEALLLLHIFWTFSEK
jgi:hypothetical protein